jgi:hypothetical protein
LLKLADVSGTISVPIVKSEDVDWLGSCNIGNI